MPVLLRFCFFVALALSTGSCTPAQRQVVATGLRTVLSLAKCTDGGLLEKYIASKLTSDPGASARFSAALVDGQALRHDVACAMYALGSAASQDGGERVSPSDRLARRAEACKADGGCRGDARSLAAAILMEAGRQGLVQLPPSGEG